MATNARTLVAAVSVFVMVLLVVGTALRNRVMPPSDSDAVTPAVAIGDTQRAVVAVPERQQSVELPALNDWNGLDGAWVAEARARCEADYPVGCTDFASALEQQLDPGVTARAFTLHRDICEQNAASYSCVVFARSLLAATDRDAAIAALERACAASAPDACHELDAILGRIAPDLTIEEQRAASQAEFDNAQATMRAEYVAACSAGDAAACHTVALLQLQSDDPSAQAVAVASLEAQCDENDRVACSELGRFFFTSDPATARVALVRACALGEADACANRDLLDGNLPIEQTPEERAAENDVNRARGEAEYFASVRAQCELGDLSMCTQAALLRLQGIGTTADEAAARTEFARLCDEGQAASCYELAVLEGVSAEPSVERRLGYYRRACQLGSLDGCREADVISQQ